MTGGRKWIVALLVVLALPLVPSNAGAATSKVLVLGDSYSAGPL